MVSYRKSDNKGLRVMDKKQKKKEFKKLFYSTLNESEIKDVLGINYREYKELLLEVKTELGLPSSYRRQPKRYWKYSEESYYILKRMTDDVEIISYCPTKEIAEIKLRNLDKDEDADYEIGQATDENLLKLVREEYCDRHNNWEGIMQKLKLPYHKFYYLLNLLKKQLGKQGNSVQDKRFIYKYAPTQKFVIKKYINGKYVIFGYYDDLDMAVKIRDYLESINWDVKVWNNNNYGVGEIANEQ